MPHDLKVTLSHKMGRDLDAYSKRLQTAVRGGLTATANLVRNTAIRSLQEGGKGGQTYRRGRSTAGAARKRVHVASAPGEAPASDTGRLVNAIEVRPARRRPRAAVVANTSYAAFLERGTRHIEPRPFLNPALSRHVRDIAVEIRKRHR